MCYTNCRVLQVNPLRRGSLTDPLLHAHARNTPSHHAAAAAAQGLSASNSSQGFSSTAPASDVYSITGAVRPTSAMSMGSSPAQQRSTLFPPQYDQQQTRHSSVTDETSTLNDTGTAANSSPVLGQSTRKLTVKTPFPPQQSLTFQPRAPSPLHTTQHYPPSNAAPYPGGQNSLKRKSLADSGGQGPEQLKRHAQVTSASIGLGQPSTSTGPGHDNATAAALAAQQERRRASLALSESAAAMERYEASAAAAGSSVYEYPRRSSGPLGKGQSPLTQSAYSFPPLPTSAGGGIQPVEDDPRDNPSATLAEYTFGRNTIPNSVRPPMHADPHDHPQAMYATNPRIALPYEQDPSDARMSHTMPSDSAQTARTIFGASVPAYSSEGERVGLTSSTHGVDRTKLHPAPKETPYSRSPELKVSHKIAERKRRKEMKELFDDLRDSIPSERGLKSSKWEILSKAIDYVAALTEDRNQLAQNIADLNRHIATLEHIIHNNQQASSSLSRPASHDRAGTSVSPRNYHMSVAPSDRSQMGTPSIHHASMSPFAAPSVVNGHRSDFSPRSTQHPSPMSQHVQPTQSDQYGQPQAYSNIAPEFQQTHSPSHHHPRPPPLYHSGSAPAALPPDGYPPHPGLHQSHSGGSTASAPPHVHSPHFMYSRPASMHSHRSNPSTHSVQSLRSHHSHTQSFHDGSQPSESPLIHSQAMPASGPIHLDQNVQMQTMEDYSPYAQHIAPPPQQHPHQMQMNPDQTIMPYQ